MTLCYLSASARHRKFLMPSRTLWNGACMRADGIRHVFHYLDDFVVLGAPGSDERSRALEKLRSRCTELGISINILKRVLDGIRRCKSLEGSRPRTRLPITPLVGSGHLSSNPTAQTDRPSGPSLLLLLRLGELLLESEASYNLSLHLSWGDVAIDARSATSMIKIYLRKSKCDQFGNGADILLGRTARLRVVPSLSHHDLHSLRRSTPGHFFVDHQEKPIVKSHSWRKSGTPCAQPVIPRSNSQATASGSGQQPARRWPASKTP